MLRAAMESAKWASRAPVARKEKDTVELRGGASDLAAADAAQSPARFRIFGLRVLAFRVSFGDALCIALPTVTEVHTRTLLLFIT
jgi:hypothetical protein